MLGQSRGDGDAGLEVVGYGQKLLAQNGVLGLAAEEAEDAQSRDLGLEQGRELAGQDDHVLGRDAIEESDIAGQK